MSLLNRVQLPVQLYNNESKLQLAIPHQAIRLYREGYPDSLNFADFRRQFEVLRIQPFEGGEGGDAVFDEREVGS